MLSRTWPCGRAKISSDELFLNQSLSQAAFSHAGVADEEDFGVRVLDLVRRGGKAGAWCFRCPCLGDEFRQIPHPDAAIVVAGEGAALIGAPRHALNISRVAFEHAQAAPRLDLPQPHGLVIGAGEGAALSALHATLLTLRMAFEHAQAAPRLHVPQPHGIVIGAGEGAALSALHATL